MTQMSNRDLRFFKMAAAASWLSDFSTHHHGCVVALGGRVLSVGWNTEKGHPLQKRYDLERGVTDGVGKLHAEMMALSSIRNLDVAWHKVRVYVWRQHKNGVRALSRPCEACRAALGALGVRHVYYTVENGYAYEKLGA